MRVQRRDRLFTTQDHRRFRTPQRKKARYSKLFVDGEVVRHPEMLLNVWVSHFWLLAKSRLEDKGRIFKRRLRHWKIKMKSFCWMCFHSRGFWRCGKAWKEKGPGFRWSDGWISKRWRRSYFLADEDSKCHIRTVICASVPIVLRFNAHGTHNVAIEAPSTTMRM